MERLFIACAFGGGGQRAGRDGQVGAWRELPPPSEPIVGHPRPADCQLATFGSLLAPGLLPARQNVSDIIRNVACVRALADVRIQLQYHHGSTSQLPVTVTDPRVVARHPKMAQFIDLELK